MAGMGHVLLLTFMAISRHMRSLASERAGSCGKGLKLKLTALSSRACRKAVCRILEASFVSLPLACGPRPGCWVDNPPGRSQASPASSQTQFAHRLPPFPGPATASVGGLVCSLQSLYACGNIQAIERLLVPCRPVAGSGIEVLSGLWPLVHTVGVEGEPYSQRDPRLPHRRFAMR